MPHPDGSVDPARDVERLDLEFILADLAIAERRLERLAGSGRHGTPAERDVNEREEVDPRRLNEALSAGRPIRDLGLDSEDAKAIRGFRFLTEKPVLVLLNVGEEDSGRRRGSRRRYRGGYPHDQTLVAALSAKIEMELGELEPDEAARLHGGARDRRVGLDRVIALSYRLLGLISFLTAGPDEVRAWPIPDGSTAVDAAAAIHTDLAQGSSGPRPSPTRTCSRSARWPRHARRGRLRSEGKTYRVKDGDVLEILFSR